MDDGHSHIQRLIDARNQIKITEQIEEYYHIRLNDDYNEDIAIKEAENVYRQTVLYFLLERNGYSTNGDIADYVKKVLLLNSERRKGEISRLNYAIKHKKLQMCFNKVKINKSQLLKNLEREY